MTAFSIDITYACAQLGSDAGASREEIEEALGYAIAYRFSTRDRIEQMRRLTEFFVVREKFGSLKDSFEEIRKSYHRQAMKLHPDRNRDNWRAEEELKDINAAYAIVDSIHREARDYYRMNEEVRREIEEEARQATERERPERKTEKQTRHKETSEENFHQSYRAETYGDSPKRPVMRYMAASIPRYIRASRLGYLRLNSIIGCWYIAAENDLNYVFDVIMLPEREFIRARHHLGVPDGMNPSLGRGRFMPAYIPRDVKTLVVPPGEPDAVAYAKKYFMREFKLDKEND